MTYTPSPGNIQNKPRNKIVSILKLIASLKLTVICLAVLAVLVIWGTVYQAEHGLYQAQQKFFYSWFFFLWGFIPFPGTVLVMFVLFFILLSAFFFRIGFRLAKIGNVITHLGILILLVGGFFTFYFSVESTLMLKEGESSRMSSSHHQWELAVWKAAGVERDIYAVDADSFKPGAAVDFDELGVHLAIKAYYKNCSAFLDNSSVGDPVLNSSGIRRLEGRPQEVEVSENTAGGVFETGDTGPTAPKPQTLLLYGQDKEPTRVTIDGNEFFFSLRKKKIILPLEMTLKDFRVKYYPNSQIPKSFESTVTIKAEGGLERDVVISMNKPLRFKDYTFFQSSYYIAPDGSEYTILAVVKNAGRLLPYFSSLTIFLGLLVHFLVMLFKRRRNNSEPLKSTKKAKIPSGLIIVTVLGILGPAGSSTTYAQVESLEQLRKVVILEQGRKKPLDTFAENILKQFSGQNTYQKQPAIHWLARVLFTPDDTAVDKVFLITNPEVLDSIGVTREGKARDRYSFSQLRQGLPRLRQLAIAASKIENNRRSFIENEMMALFSKLYTYQELQASFDFLFPHPDFTVTEPGNLEALGFPQKKHFSFFHLAERIEKIRAIEASLQGKSQEEWSGGEKEIVSLAHQLEQWASSYQELPLTIIPTFASSGWHPQPIKDGASESVKPLELKQLLVFFANFWNALVKGGEEKWLSPWDMMSPVILVQGTTIPKSLFLLRDVVDAYRSHDQQKFNTALQEFNRLILEQAGRHIRTRAISREVFYNRLEPFYKAKFFYGFAVLFLLLSLMVLRKWLYRLAFLLLGVGFLLHLYGVLTRMYINLRPPVTNLYETFLFTGLIAVLLGILLEFFKKRNLGIAMGGLAGLVMLMIAGKYALEGDTMGMLVAVLDSNFWLASHVITIILGYAGIVLSGFIGHVYIIQRIIARPGKEDLLNNTFQAVYAIQAFGIIFTFLGTVLGGIWADQSWGRFWGWDPKENGALLILLWSAILFHARLAKMIKETGFAVGTVFGVIAVALAWFGVNLLGVGLHSYGFTSGIAQALFIFIGIEVLFVAITLPLCLRRRSATAPLEGPTGHLSVH